MYLEYSPTNQAYSGEEMFFFSLFSLSDCPKRTNCFECLISNNEQPYGAVCPPAAK